MYTQEYLAKERQHERLRQAEQERSARQVTELRKLEKRQERAERQLLPRGSGSSGCARRSGQSAEKSGGHAGNPGCARAIPGFFLPYLSWSGDRRGVRVPGHPADHLGAERPLALKLAEHADPGGRHPVDQHVGRRQVELAGDVARGAQVGDPARLARASTPWRT